MKFSHRIQRAFAGAATALLLVEGIYAAADLRLSGPTHFGQLGEGKMNYDSSFLVLRPAVTDVSVGFAHVLYVDSAGVLWGYGSNDSNQIGSGSLGIRVTPTGIATDVASVHAGIGWSFYIKQNGDLYALGRIGGGVWGPANAPPRITVPVRIATSVRKVDTRVAHAAFLFEDGTLRAQGYEPYIGGVNPVFHQPLVGVAANVADVALSSSGIFYLTNAGQLFGVGLAIPGSVSLNTIVTAPLHVANNVVHIAAGGELVFYVNSAGQLYGMGASESGALGLGEDMLAASTPQLIASGVKRVYTDGETTFFIDATDDLWGFGDNLYGQLGDTSFQDRFSPVEIIQDVADVSTRRTATLAVRLDGSMVGAGNFELLGIAPHPSKSVPDFAAEDIAAVEIGDQSIFYIDDEGKLFGVGRNDRGQLGLGSFDHVDAPAEIAADVAQVSASATHMLYLTEAGNAMGAGANGSGQLGAGDTSVNEPMLVASSATSVAAGNGFSLFTTAASQSLWYVGAADNEAILGDTEPASMPHLLATGVIDASAASNVFYVNSAGELRVRGSAFTVPAQSEIDGDGSALVDTGVAEVETSGNYAIYRKTDQTLWGVGAFPAFASAGSVFYPTPVLIDSSVAKARSGSLAFMYQKVDGSLWLRASSLEDARRLGYQYGDFEYGSSLRIWSGAVIDDFSINSYNVGLLTNSVSAPALGGATISKTSVAAGEETELDLAATGLFLDVKWFLGPVGNETNPVPEIDGLLGATVYPDGDRSYWARVENELGSVSMTTPLSVSITNPTYAAWGRQLGLSGRDLWHNADADADGILNGLEYAFGLDPVIGNAPMPRIDAIAEGYVMRHPVDPEAKVTLVYEASDDLVEWTPYPTEGRLTVVGDTNALLIPTSEADAAVFVRVKSTFVED